jgi:hypothetical protein
MRGRMLAALAMAMNGAAANASDAVFDTRLARAASEIVAAKMGPLRGGLQPGELVLVQPSETARARPKRRPHGVWENGLAIAVERKPRASPEL